MCALPCNTSLGLAGMHIQETFREFLEGKTWRKIPWKSRVSSHSSKCPLPVLCGRPSNMAPYPGGALTSTHPLVIVWYPHHLVGEAPKFRADNGDKDGTH